MGPEIEDIVRRETYDVMKGHIQDLSHTLQTLIDAKVRVHTRTHAHARVRARARTLAHTHKHTHTHAHTYTHTRTHTHTHAHMRICMSIYYENMGWLWLVGSIKL